MGYMDKMSNLYSNKISSNSNSLFETKEEKIERLKKKFGLKHGKGKRKRKKK